MDTFSNQVIIIMFVVMHVYPAVSVECAMDQGSVDEALVPNVRVSATTAQ